MPAGPRQLLEARFSQISVDLEALFAEARDRTRREFAEQLNQAVRRLRIAPDPDELCSTLNDAAAFFASGAILFRIENDTARSARIDVPLADAPVLAAAVRTQDPLVALATPAEISAPLVELAGHADGGRAHVFPVAVSGAVPALIYAWGTVEGPAIELLTQVAAAVWSGFPKAEPTPAPGLVNIQPAPDRTPVKAAASWTDLPPQEQQIHLRAQRFARVQIAEMRLFHSDAVQSGRARRNLYDALQPHIDAARDAFHAQFFACPSMVDYVDLELTRTLANEDPDLLGKSYPGPLV